MARHKYYYAAFVEGDGNNRYSHFTMRIFRKNVHASMTELCTLSWQGEAGASRWYAGSITPYRCTTVEDLNAVSNALHTLLGDASISIYEHPEYVIQRANEKKWEEVVYDSRVSEYVPISKVLGPEFHMWGDDQRVCSCVASTEDEARKMLSAKMLKYGYGYQHDLWKENGEQVLFLVRGGQVDTTRAMEKLQSPSWYKKEE